MTHEKGGTMKKLTLKQQKKRPLLIQTESQTDRPHSLHLLRQIVRIHRLEENAPNCTVQSRFAVFSHPQTQFWE